MPRIGNVDVPENLVGVAAVAPRPDISDILSAAAQSTVGQLRYGLPYQAARLTGTLTPEAEQRYLRGLAETSAAASAAPPASIPDLTSGRVGLTRFIGENFVASLPYMVGSAVGGGVGYARGGAPGAVIGAIAGGTPQFSASNVARAVDEQGALTDASAARSLAVAPFQSAADVAIARFLPGAGKVLGDVAATQTGGFIRRTATSMLKAGGTEAVTEAAQQVGERFAAGLKLNDADAAGEYVNAAVTAFALGGVLGAGGGFRRTNADAKPADMVTVDDMNAKIDGILDGSLRALPAPQNLALDAQGNQIALPSPAMLGRQPAGPDVSGGPAIRLENPTDFIVDSEGRTVPPGLEGERALAIDRNQPQVLRNTFSGNITPEVQVALEQAMPAGVDVPLTGSTMLGRGFAGPQGSVPTLEDYAALPAGADLLQAGSGAQVVSSRVNPATGAEIPFDDFLAEQKKGLRGGFVQSVQATDEMDLLKRVYEQVFVEQDSRANTAKFAQRLGLLDEQLKPTELAQYVETAREGAAVEEQAPAAGATTTAPPSPVTPGTASAGATTETLAVPVGSPRMTPQAPADATFAARWEELKKAAGIQRMRSGRELVDTPANLEQAQTRVMDALAKVDAFEAPETDQVEALARKMGLVTDDAAMDITPLGRQVFLSTSKGLEETVSAAQQQGYTGAQASIFDRGVRAQVAGETAAPTFTSFDDMAAFQAGQVWAKDFVENAETRTAAQTDAIRGRQDARATGTVVERPEGRRVLSPAQVQQQAMNRLIDAADLRGVNDTDVAELRRLVRGGATATEVGAALQRVQGGQTLFQQPPTAPVMLSTPQGRGQPVFKEMSTPDAAPGRAENRAESEAAVGAYDARNLIEFAKAEGGITEARAQKLHDLLDQGKVNQVKNSLKAFDPDAKPARRLPTPPEIVDQADTQGRITGGADAAFEAAIDGKDLDGVLEHMIEVAPSKYHREMMRKVKAAANNMRKAGVDVSVQIVRPGDVAPVVLNRSDVRAFTVSTLNPPASRVYLKGSEMGASSGMNYQLTAHELLHAVTSRLISYGRKDANTKIGKDVKDLTDLANAIISHFNQRAADGKLNEFEKAYFKRQNNALANADEILAWGMTNPDMQRYLQSIEYKPRQSVFGRLVELLRNLLGLDGKYDTALTELLRVSERIMTPGQNDLVSAHAKNNPEGFDTAPLAHPAMEEAPRTVQGSNDTVQRISQAASAALEKIQASNTVQNFGDTARKIGLGAFSRNHIDEVYGSVIPGLLDDTRAGEARKAVRNIFQRIGESATQAIEKLRQAKDNQSREDAKRINRLMQVAQFGIDGAKTWEQHEQLHDEPNVARLKEQWSAARKDYNDLARHGTVGVFEEARAANEAQNLGHMLGQLHDRIANDEQYSMGVPGGKVSPGDALIAKEGIGTAAQLRAHIEEDLDQRVAAAKAYLEAQSQAAATLAPKDRAAIESRQAPLDHLLAEIAKNRALMRKTPYFHLPRFGDHFAAFTIHRGEDGKVDKTALQVVARAVDELAEGGIDAQLSTDNTNPRVMIRTESKSQAAALGKLGLELERQGFVEKGTTLSGGRDRANNFGLGGRVPDYLAQALDRLETDPTFQPDAGMTSAEAKALAAQLSAARQALVDGWLDMQPDNSLSKVLAQRKNVQGASQDMIRGFAHRQNVGSVGVANLMTRSKFSDALRTMRAAVEDAHHADNDMDPYLTSQVVTEVRRRRAEVPVNEVADSFDKGRAITHAYFLGLNPSSAVINMTALGTTVLPELAKKSGYAKSFHAMRRASVQAYQILKTAAVDAQQREIGHKADLSLTEDVLAKASIPEDVRSFIRKRIADGDIDLGTMTRQLGQIAEGRSDTTLDKGLKYGSAFNIYTEAFARLTAAIAARELHGSGNTAEAHDYARSVVKNSLMSFAPDEIGRQFGKQGILGPVTPIVTQFMQWNLQVTEKLVREFRDAIGRQRTGETSESAAQRRKESQRFLVGHMTAMTALAGSLGLPFATVFASVLERIVGDDDDPFDASAEWRNFLARVFGQDVGEVLARGLPRAFGVDLSQRAGEQNLLPFSDLLADKRPWKDAVGDSVGRGIGAAPSMAVSILDGGSRLADGDLLGGMKAILPTFLKNPVEAYRMTNEGYIDGKGNKLPLSPGAGAILWQLLGFSPAEKAEYGEARGDQAARRGELSREATRLRQRIVQATLSGDAESARELIAQAIQFDTDNPGFAVVPSLQSSMQRTLSARAQAVRLATPLGVPTKDIAGQQLTQYANINYAQ